MLMETDGQVSVIAATLASLDADDEGGPALAAMLGLNDPLSWPPQFDDSDTRNWMRALLADHPDEPGYGSWYIAAGGRLVGIAGYKGPPQADAEIEIGYSVIEAEQRRGYASAAVRLLIERAFLDPRVQSVSAHTLPSLVASQRVLMRTGFSPDGSTADPEHGEILRFMRRRGAA